MTYFVSRFPAIVNLLLIFAALMLIPALHAAGNSNWPAARTFLYHAIFLAIVGTIVGLATMNIKPRYAERYYLFSLMGVYALLPIALAAPLYPLVAVESFWQVYFEMVSCLTTTGATIFDRPSMLAQSLHLWRALVGWFGGFIVLVMAFAILAPSNLGGFEIGADISHGFGTKARATANDGRAQILRMSLHIAPAYIGATFALGLILIFLGDDPFVGIIHAMSTISTSGISPIRSLDASGAGWYGEVAIALFLLPAISHHGINSRIVRGQLPDLSNPQVRLMLICVTSVTLLLTLRAFIGASALDRQSDYILAARAIWGSIFTSLSFLSTMGFESHDWRTMQIWSGLSNPGVILLGLATMGGGVATTAGGIKLLRLYALYRHGLREMDKLIHPSSVGGRAGERQYMSDRAQNIAFVFLMLFLVSLGLMLILFSFSEMDFEHNLVASVAALTTTGPALHILADGTTYADLDVWSQGVFCVGMIVGRMEALVIVSLFNPNYWRS